MLTLADGEEVRADQVVVAVGLTYFAHIPPALDDLPPDRVTHTWGHLDASSFSGKDVIVVGGGSSALETATLLHENGSRVQVLARSDVRLEWPGAEGSEAPTDRPDQDAALLARTRP